MYHGKYTFQRRKHSRLLALLLSLTLILGVAGGSTLAYLTDTTAPAVNIFTPSKVTCIVNESFNKVTKSNVTIQNTGDTDAFIRAMVIVTWKNADGEVYAEAPAAGDYTIGYNKTDWTPSGNYWYCNTEIKPTSSTPVLITSCTANGTAPEGYSLSVEILADAIQSEPQSAAREAWGYLPGSSE